MNRTILLVFLIGLLGGTTGCENPGSNTPGTGGTDSLAAEIIYQDAAGNVLTKKDLDGVTSKIPYEIHYLETIPPDAAAAHRRGRQFGSQGKHAEALAFFREAQQLAPTWPYPTYDMAYTYLLQDEYSLALRHYEIVDSLAPDGFFTCKTALWTLRKEAAGEFQPGLYRAFLMIEFEKDPARKKEIAEGILTKYPGFAPAWKTVAGLYMDDNQRLGAIQSGLSAGPDTDTYGLLRINEALVIDRMGDKPRAKKMLGELIFDKSSTLSTRVLAKASLASVNAGTWK